MLNIIAFHVPKLLDGGMIPSSSPGGEDRVRREPFYISVATLNKMTLYLSGTVEGALSTEKLPFPVNVGILWRKNYFNPTVNVAKI